MSSGRSWNNQRPSQEQLLSVHVVEEVEMADLNQGHVKSQMRVQAEYEDAMRNGAPSTAQAAQDGAFPGPVAQIEYKVYKRRWFGLLQLILLNIIVSWDVCISVEGSEPM